MAGRFRYRLAIGFILLLATFTASPQTKKAAARKQGAGDEFKTLIDRYYTEWNTLNPDNAAPLYAKDAGLVFYDITPLKYNGWEEYKEGVKKILGQFSSATFSPHEDLKVTRRGNLAWTSVTFHMAAKPKTGAPMELDGRHTAIWQKREGRWLIVHEHFSAPLPGPPDTAGQPLYKRLGGYDAIAAVTDDFVGRLVSDSQLARFFTGASTDSKLRIRQLVVDQLCAATGGPCVYIGRSMKTAHAGLAITEADWQASVNHLVSTLDKFNVPQKEKEELLAIASSLKNEIVTSTGSDATKK